MATLGVVRSRPSPVLGEKERQPMAGSGEVARIRIDRHEDRIRRGAGIEVIDEPFEERHAAGGVVERGLVSHGRSLGWPPLQGLAWRRRSVPVMGSDRRRGWLYALFSWP